MSRVLITGATGFIGRACLNSLKKTNLEIHATHRNKPLINNEISWHPCDILNPIEVSALINKIKPDYLLHLAWIVDHEIYWTSEKNINYIVATIHLYKEFSLQGGKKAIFLGTCAEYDSSHSICEENTTPLNPSTLYGLCKKQTIELLTQLKCQEPSHADFSWVRLFNIYGPYEHQERLIPYLFSSYLQEKIPILESPYSIRDYIHVQNLADILVCLLKKNSPPIINAGTGNKLSIEGLAKIIHARFFRTQIPTYQVTNNLKKPDCFIPDLTILQKLNIQTPLSFESSLDNTFEWFKSQSPAYKKINMNCESYDKTN